MARQLSQEEQDEIVRRAKRGDPLRLIAFALGRDEKAISKVIRDAGLGKSRRSGARAARLAWVHGGK